MGIWDAHVTFTRLWVITTGDWVKRGSGEYPSPECGCRHDSRRPRSRSPSTPDPGPRTASCSSASGRRSQRRRHGAARWALPRAARSAAGHPGARARRRGRIVRRRAGRFEPGDRVMAIVAGGGQAELAVVHERTAMPVPTSSTGPRRAASPRSFHRARRPLQPGRPDRRRAAARHGAAGGVGMAAVQLGEMARGARDRDGPRRARPRSGRGARAYAIARRGSPSRRVRRDPRARRSAEASRRTSTRWRSAAGSP